MQQMPQRYFCTVIARRLPFGDNRGLIQRKATVCHHQANQYSSNAFGHGPANQPRVRAVSRRITFRNNAAALHDDQSAGFANSGIFEKRCDGIGQLLLAHRCVVGDLGKARANGLCRRLCAASSEGKCR